ILLLAVIYRTRILAMRKKYLISALAVGILVVIPMILYIMNNKQALLRVTGTSIFSNQTQILKSDIIRLQRDAETNDLIGTVLDNRRFIYASTIISNYIIHFDPRWLFIRGDIQRHHAPSMGLLYLFEFPFILYGIYLLIFSDFNPKAKLLFFVCLLIVPIPASVTFKFPH